MGAIALAHLEDASCLRDADHPVDEPPLECAPSVFAVVAHAQGTSLLTTKPTLIAFSHAMEDDLGTQAPDSDLFGFFQRGRYYESAAAGWGELAGRARSAHVFADFDGPTPTPAGPAPVAVDLSATDPMRLEWAIVVQRTSGPMALSARERPGQEDLAEDARLFDSTWTTHPPTVRRAAILCATLAARYGSTAAAEVRERLTAAPGAPSHADPHLVDRLLNSLLERLVKVSVEP